MTRRKKILIIATVLLALIALILFLLSRPTEAPAEPAAPEPEAPAAELEPAGGVAAPARQVAALNPAPEPEAEQAPPGYVPVAELFAERYGSYSNQEAYANLRDLLPIMTAAYRARAEAQIAASEGQPPAASYEGVTSVKVTSKEISYDGAGSAVVDVSLQQSKTVGTSAPEVAYRTLRVELVRLGEEWRVDAVAWRT